MVKAAFRLALLAGLLAVVVATAHGGAFFSGRTQSSVINLATLTGPVRIVLAYGQSRADNRAQGTNICAAGVTSPKVPISTFMMNNARQPGHYFEGDFVASTASALIPYQGCYGTGQNVPLGQDLGPMVWALQADDAAAARGIIPRIYIAAGEGGRPIADLQKNAAPYLGGGAVVNVTGAANNGSGAIRLTLTGLNTATTTIGTGSVISVSGVTGTTEANGSWTVTAIDATHVDLQGSTFTNTFAHNTNVSAATANSDGEIRLTVATPNSIVSGNIVQVGGMTGCAGGNGSWIAVKINSTTYDLARSIAAGCAYTVGGFVDAGLAGGFVIYQRMLNMVTRACQLAAAYGKTCSLESEIFLQGESDPSISVADYETALTTLIGTSRPDLMAITGQVTNFAFIINQVGSDSDGTPLPATQAQYNMIIANADGNTWGNGPEYQFPYFSSFHQTVNGVVMDGEQFAWASNLLLSSSTPAYLRPTSLNLVGSTITATFNVPSGCIVEDVTTLPAATDAGLKIVKGFHFTDDSGKQVASVTVTGCTTLAIALSGVPTTNKVLKYGIVGPGAATPLPPAWGNYRDSRASASRFLPGVTLRNWMMSFSLTVSSLGPANDNAADRAVA